MKTIYKYEISINDEFTVRMPINAEILSVQSQPQNGLVNDDKAFMWAIVGPAQRSEIRKFHLIGEGDPFPNDHEHYAYIGTFQMCNGRLVWHLFEERG